MWNVNVEGICFRLVNQGRPLYGGDMSAEIFLEAGYSVPRLEISKPKENQVNNPTWGMN